MRELSGFPRWRVLLVLFAVVAGLVGLLQSQNEKTAEPPDPEFDAFKEVLVMGHALESEGVMRREAVWSGTVTQGMRVLIPVFLFEQNEYFFLFGSSGNLNDLKIRLHEGLGPAVRTTSTGNENRQILVYAPELTQRYHLELSIPDEGRPLDLAVSYGIR